MNTEAPKKPSWIKSKIARIGLSVAALGGLGGAAYVADQQGLIDIPGIHQNVENNLPVYPTFVELNPTTMVEIDSVLSANLGLIERP